MIDVAEALRILVAAGQPLDLEELDLSHATGRVLAEQVLADRDFPPTDRSAMDGFAVRAADLARPERTLRVVGEVRAGGSVSGVRVEPGQAARIMTGGVVPDGADAVVMVERTQENREQSEVIVRDSPTPGQHIRRRGEELRRGAVVLDPGVPIHAAEIAALASVGKTRVRVHRLPIVHVLSTGDEIVEPDTDPEPHQVRNSNAYALLAQLRELGITGTYAGIATDDRDVLRDRLEGALAADYLLITGGVSVGDYDFVGETLRELGMRQLFHRIAVKPGKPMLAGRRASCVIVGLPGNPVSTYTGFAVFVAPTLRRAMGHRHWANVELEATLADRLETRPGRETYHLARLEAVDRKLVAHLTASRGSGDVLAMTRANGFVVTPSTGATREPGASVRSMLWRDFHLR